MAALKRTSYAVFVVCVVVVWVRGAGAGIIDPCQSTAAVSPVQSEYHFIACPQGDTDSFLDQGFSITIDCRDSQGFPIVGIPATDVWLIGEPEVTLCGGSASSNADGPSDVNGVMTMSQGTVSAGGCSETFVVVLQGWIIYPGDCSGPNTLPITWRSPDLDGNLAVDLLDFAAFQSSYPPQPYETCADLDSDGVVNIRDFARFGLHYGHACP